MKLIVKVRDIPHNKGWKVTKIGGTKKFSVLNKITIYMEKGDKQVIESDKDCFFLMGGTNINAVSGDKEVILVTENDKEILNFIEEHNSDNN